MGLVGFSYEAPIRRVDIGQDQIESLVRIAAQGAAKVDKLNYIEPPLTLLDSSEPGMVNF